MSPAETAQTVLTPGRATVVKLSDLQALAQAYLELQALAQTYADSGRSDVAWVGEPQALVTPPVERWAWRVRFGAPQVPVPCKNENEARTTAAFWNAEVLRRFEFATEWEEVP